MTESDSTRRWVRASGTELIADGFVIKEVGTRGGRLREIQPGLFWASSVVLYGESAVWVTADAVELASKEEVFPIAVAPVPAPRPGLAPFCPLEGVPGQEVFASVLGTPLRAEILTWSDTESDEVVLVDTGILLSSPRGDRLLIESPHEPIPGYGLLLPLNLTLTVAAEVIEQRLECHRLRPAG